MFKKLLLLRCYKSVGLEAQNHNPDRSPDDLLSKECRHYSGKGTIEDF